MVRDVGGSDAAATNHGPREADLEVAGVSAGLLVGYGFIGVGLTILLIGLGWSATRRLRSLPDDPRPTRALIVVGLVVAAIGVILAALTVGTG